MNKKLIAVLLGLLLIVSFSLNTVTAQDLIPEDTGAVAEAVPDGSGTNEAADDSAPMADNTNDAGPSDPAPAADGTGDAADAPMPAADSASDAGLSDSAAAAGDVSVTIEQTGNSTSGTGVSAYGEDTVNVSGSVIVTADTGAVPVAGAENNYASTYITGTEASGGGDVSVANNVDVSVDASFADGFKSSSANVTGVSAASDGTVTVGGNVTVDAVDPGITMNGGGYTNVTGVGTQSEGTVTVEGNVTVETDISVNGSGSSDISGVNAGNSGKAAVGGEVNVDVEASYTVGEDEYGSVQTRGIVFDQGAEVSAGDVNVQVTSTGGTSATAKGIDSGYTGTGEDRAEFSVQDNVTVRAESDGGYVSAYGINNQNGNSEGTVGGQVTAEAKAPDGSASAYGVYENVSGNSTAEMDLSIAGDVNVTAEGKDAVGSGVVVYNSSEGPVAVWTDKIDVNAQASDGSASATGIQNNASDNGDTNVNIAEVVVVAEGDAEEEKYTETHWYYPGTPAESETNTGEATTIVRGDVTVEADSSTLQASATGINASSYGNPEPTGSTGGGSPENSEPYEVTNEYTRTVSAAGVSTSGTDTKVSVEGDVNVTADSNRAAAAGISAYSYNDGITIVDVGGSITVSTSDGDLNKADTEAIYAMLTGSGSVEITVGTEENVDENGIATEGGNITSDGNGIDVNTNRNASGTVEIEVKGDVKAENYGLEINTYSDEAVADIIVNGTLSGKEASIVVGTETTADNVQLTVWKVDLTEVEGEDEDHAVTQETAILNEETQKYEVKQTVTEETKKIEENIRYIIKIEKNPNAALGVEGTEKVDGYDTAKEGDSVIFKIAPNEGYTVLAAYNGLGEKVPLAKDANGNYYVVVERGGGVYLSVELGGGTQPVEPEPTPEPKNEDNEQPGEQYNNQQNAYYYAMEQNNLSSTANDQAIVDLLQERIDNNEILKKSLQKTKIDLRTYYSRLNQYYDKKDNPMEDPDISDFVYQYLYAAEFTPAEIEKIIDALKNPGDQKYQALYLYSLFDYSFGDIKMEEKTAFYSNEENVIKLGKYIRLEGEMGKTNFLDAFFHESGHAVQLNRWDAQADSSTTELDDDDDYADIFIEPEKLRVKIFAYESWDDYSPNHYEWQYSAYKAGNLMLEMNIAQNLILDVFDTIKTKLKGLQEIDLSDDQIDFIAKASVLYGSGVKSYDEEKSFYNLPLIEDDFLPGYRCINQLMLFALGNEDGSLFQIDDIEKEKMIKAYMLMRKEFIDEFVSIPYNNGIMVEDIYNGVTTNQLGCHLTPNAEIDFDGGKVENVSGHPTDGYWIDGRGNIVEESWAEFFSSNLLGDSDALKYNRRYFEKSYPLLEKLADRLYGQYREMYSAIR